MWNKFHSQILIHWRATPLPVVKGNDLVKYKISLYDSLPAPHFTMLPQNRIGVFRHNFNEEEDTFTSIKAIN